MDKAIVAFIIANGAVAYDHDVTIFATFWGLTAFRIEQPAKAKKDWLAKAFGWMMPRGANKLPLSKMNMLGMGRAMINHVMKKHNALTLPQLIELGKEIGVKLVACTMTMDLLGIQREELIDGVELAGVAAYLSEAAEAKANLFI